MDLLDELLLLLRLEAVVPLCQAGLAGAVLDQDELDGHGDGEEEEGEEEAGTERHEIAEKKKTQLLPLFSILSLTFVFQPAEGRSEKRQLESDI